MANTFYKISCVNPQKECNIIRPISKKADFAGLNPVTGRQFNTDDIEAVMTRYSSMCLNRNGTEKNCCDPAETRLNVPDGVKERYNKKKLRINKEYGKITSIDICDKPEDCKGSEWQVPTPYLMCKIGDNDPKLKNNVLNFDSLNPDCYAQKCNTQDTEVDFGQLISGSGKSLESSFLTDLKLAEQIAEDNSNALKKYLDNYLQKYKRSGANQILIDNDSGDTLLLRAIRTKANNCVNLLLSNNADLNLKTIDTGMTPLHYACKYGNEALIATLINYGARTDVTDFEGRPPIFYAIIYGDAAMVAYLGNQNPSLLNYKDKYGNSTLHIAFKYSKDPGNISNYLISMGVSTEAKNNKGLLPIEVANRRIDKLKIDEQKQNSEMFLEPFITLGKAEEEEPSKNKLISKLETGVSIVEKAHVNENQNIYNKFVSPLDNLKGPVDFNNYGCYPYANLETEAECKKNGGHWSLFEKEQKLTTAKVEYKYSEQNLDEDGEDDDLEYELNGKIPEDKIHYYKVKSELVADKKLPPLDHDSIMCNYPTPTPTSNSIPNATTPPPYKCPIPSSTPASTPSSPPSSTPSSTQSLSVQMKNSTSSEDLSPIKETMETFESYTALPSKNNNQSSRYHTIINIAIITIIVIILLLLLYKKYKTK
jgi:ankyrin repeat protein